MATDPDRKTQAAAVALMAVVVVLAALAVRSGGFWDAAQVPTEEASALPGLLVRPVFIDGELLAQFVMRRRVDQTIIDLRPEADHQRWHIPGAIQLDPAVAVATDLIALTGGDPDRELVLYDEDGHDAFDVAVELLRRGHEHVHVLLGGLRSFRREVLTPPSLRGILSESLAHDQTLVWAERRRFFLEGGHALVPGASDPESLESPAVVSTAWLEARLQEVVAIDARDAASFARGHLPGAISLPLPSVRANRDGVDSMLLPAEELSDRLAALGLGASEPVAIYGERMHDETLLALALLRGGQTRVAVLEGGWGAWLAEGRPETAQLSERGPVERAVPGADGFTMTTSEVAAAVDEGQALILDMRRPEEYAGLASAVAGRGGHVPGARNHDFTLDYAPGRDGGHWRDIARLRSAYEALGASAEREVVVYCQSGHRASHAYFTLRYMLGFTKVRWYDGSWKAWAASPYPVDSPSSSE